MSFYAKLEAAARRNDTLLCVGLDPTPEACPVRFQQAVKTSISETESEAVRKCQALLAWNRAVIDSTSDLVCCYKPNIAFYEALGQPGMALLRATIAAVPTDIPVLLDAKRGDIGSTAAAYARACFEELGVDAVTLSPYLGEDSISPFAAYPDKGLFVLCHTSNPSAGAFQRLTAGNGRNHDGNDLLFLRVATEAVSWSPAVGLVVGATYPQALADVRAVAPDAWLLAPGIGAQGGDLEAALKAGLRADGLGVLVAATRSVTQADDPRQAALRLREDLNAARAQCLAPSKIEAASSAPQPSPVQASHRDLVTGLAELGALQFGDFTLASGKRSSMYVDLRLLVSQPDLMQAAAAAYAQELAALQCDRIAGVPYAALPIGMAVALASGVPLIYNRKESKSHGLGKDIEGLWQPGERVVIIEDVITTGGSIVSSVELFRVAGLVVEDAIVLLDRQQGGVENLRKAGIRVHSVLALGDVLDLLSETGHIPAEIRQSLGLSVSAGENR
ncbi:MAG: orotidine-5'-phosphate decarboxylase [Caldilineaceae bacterium SB0661_bin_32]|uniref:Orotate phosphoribosyltransferase n=1 Tax=Caldilineaceae bacterium SB0661_bin_32 TaxID=2605255 RepID=A0A6B1D497_9CHLR|nr:orotidine-5'-phosphate decarboxylase [Caldilineaceae bacterium SB0661_bin_32]